MPRKQHLVRLSRDDRRYLTRLVRTGRHAAWTLQRARIRAAWGQRGLACLTRQPQVRPSVPSKLSAAQSLEIAALACTDPPPGHARWSLRLLATRVVEVGIVDAIAPETIRKALQKGGSLRGAPSAS
jgi:hypothetical protein